MKLIVQPRDGLGELISAIRRAKKEIDLVIFRFDRPEIVKALETAIKRGVRVRTLIGYTNRGGEKTLRRLEERLLQAGAIVSRTGDEFVRYHDKLMVVDRSVLWLMCFNLTALDTSRSRSFAIVTGQRAEVQQALRLFEADATRQPYDPTDSQLVVSPETARPMLTDFIRKTRQQLLIYDPKVSDPSMLASLRALVKDGVDVRLIGRVSKKGQDLPHERFPGYNLHARIMIRDRRVAFLGSQSLRRLELDKRREVGLLVKHPGIVNELLRTFEGDWDLTESGKRKTQPAETATAASATTQT